MILGIMQPYFFPYLGYFALIKSTDQFILFDTPQFIRHGWIERNRVLNSNGDWQYISVPLMKHSQKTAINQIKINNNIDWQTKIKNQLIHYKKAPYYFDVMEVVNDVLNGYYENIVDLNRCALKKVCLYLEIKADLPIFSEMNLNIDPVVCADEWALNICKAIGGVEEYWNLPGGKEFFNIEKYIKAGISLKFQKTNLKEYKRGRYPFQPALSIIDVMMYNSLSQIHDMLDDFSFI